MPWPIGLLPYFGRTLLIGSGDHVCLASALYPAALFASFEPVTALKGKLFQFGKHVWLRKGLVITQFLSFSIFHDHIYPPDQPANPVYV